MKRGRVKMKGTLSLYFKARHTKQCKRTHTRTHPRDPRSDVFCAGWARTFSASPQTAPVATGSDASVSCHLSSSLAIPKKGVRSLPPRPRPADGVSRRMTFWGWSYTPPLFRIPTGMALRAGAAWDRAEANPPARNIFDAAVVFVSCPNNWTQAMWVEWTPMLCPLNNPFLFLKVKT